MIGRLRNYFLAGLVIAAPVSVTIWLTWSLIAWVDGWIRPLIPARFSPETYLRFTIPGFGLVVAVLMLTLIGFLAANIIGRTILGYGERVVGRMPLVRAIYRAVKQLFESVISDRARSFQKVGLIQFPRPGVWCIGFVATETRGEVAHRLAAEGERIYSVFVPPTPAPTAGFVLFLRESDIIFLDMSVEDAAKMVLSMGLVSPDWQPRRATSPGEAGMPGALAVESEPSPGAHPAERPGAARVKDTVSQP